MARGFAAMAPEKARAIQSKGGRVANALGLAHKWTLDEARAAGRKGGIASRGGKGKVVPPQDLDRPSVGNDVPGGGANP